MASRTTLMPGVNRSWRARSSVSDETPPSGQQISRLPGQERSPFEGDPLGQQQDVPRLRPGGPDDALPRRVAEHRPHDDGTVETVGDLGVAADERYVHVLTGGEELLEDLLRLYRSALLREEDSGQEPSGRAAQAGDVVGVDLHRIPADEVRGEGDRVGRGDQDAVAPVEDRRIGAHLGPHEYPGVVANPVQQAGQQVAGEFAPREAARCPGRTSWRMHRGKR